ncbi:MmpS family transport accessory protein [Actinoplanes sp. N902-109]|uniref:MmpS family transport accessory protein n=1 Tax=Actinoplanes sp. (strain N902-109) TaxID=649831 RepID=UPI0003296564|nr:MmpS family transport accessory protein [Actinoplanes sp. N902-109]AGL15607.1 hypothetical protein L083_2097 [Actinoplanes sp. N902-109]
MALLDAMMFSTRRAATAACGLALALALAGCGGGGGPHGGDPGGPVPTRADWPQPVDGQLTTEMCDLLGPDDYHAAGAVAAAFDERSVTPRSRPTMLSCHSAGENWLTLDLQPSAASGGIYYDWMRRDHAKRVGDSAELRENVVPGADESWYDAAAGGHQLVVRRGSLIVGIHFGFLNEDADQPAAMTTLAGLVLQRTAAGTTDTGKAHHATLTITGRPARPGPVDISYLDPNTTELVEVKGVTLPWTQELDFAWYGQTRAITVQASLQQPGLAKYLSCKVTIDGKAAGESMPQVSFTTCRGEYSEAG